jgi:AcrR family transcriptional regulator
MPPVSRRPNAKSAQREATRKRLLDAARRLFAEHGYSGVSTTEIARAAGVTHGSIHAHFHSKPGLLFELIAESNQQQQQQQAEAAFALGGDCRTRLRAILDVYLKHDLADLELLGVMQGYSWRWPYDLERRNQRQLAEALGPLRKVIDLAAETGELRKDVDADRLVRIVFALYTMCLRAAIFEDAATEAVAAEIDAQLCIVLEGARPAR